MEVLKERILKEGVVASDQVLKLDGLLNHQVDPELTMEMGREFAVRFREENITRVVTVESSGIAIGFATALELGVPLVFARRKRLYWPTRTHYANVYLPLRKALSRTLCCPVNLFMSMTVFCSLMILSPMVMLQEVWSKSFNAPVRSWSDSGWPWKNVSKPGRERSVSRGYG